MPFHEVVQGETLMTIAQDAGLTGWRDIYDRSENAAFKKLCEEKKRDPNILYPGEKIFVPNKSMLHDPRSVDATHLYKLSPPPTTRLRIVLEAPDGTPLPDQAWTLTVEGKEFSGTTGSDGLIDVAVPLKAASGTLKFQDQEWTVAIGHLNPLTADVPDAGLSGAQGRLANLALYDGPIDGNVSDATTAAILQFQELCGLEASGELDDATRAELLRAHGS